MVAFPRGAEVWFGFLCHRWMVDPCLKIADFKMELKKDLHVERKKTFFLRFGDLGSSFQIDPAQLSYYSVFSMVHMCDGTRATASLHPK